MENSILVTGAAGFIGARLVEKLEKTGSVISVDQLQLFETRPEHRNIRFQTRVDQSEIFRWLKETKPKLNAIVHLGACTDTTELDKDFLQRNNVEYSQQLWNYATETKVPFVYASSAATYGDGQEGYCDNESLMTTLKPLNPYGESKRLFDVWVLEQEKSGAPVPPSWSGFKFFNVYGFGERHKGRMASVILQGFDQIRKIGKMRLFKSHKEGIPDGHQKRDFIFVDDVVDVLCFALEKPIRRGIFNLGTGKARTFLDLAKATFKALGAPENIEFFDTPIDIRERYQYFTEAEMNKLRNEGYTRPFTSLEDGVQKTVDALKKV